MKKHELSKDLTIEQLHELALEVASGKHIPNRFPKFTEEQIKVALEKHIPKAEGKKRHGVLGSQQVDFAAGYPFKSPHTC